MGKGKNATPTVDKNEAPVVRASKSSKGFVANLFNSLRKLCSRNAIRYRRGLPIVVGVGIDLIAVVPKGRRLIALINEPTLEAKTTFGASTDGSTCATGSGFSLEILAPTRLDFFGLRSVDLFTPSAIPLISGCKALGATPKHSAAHEKLLLARQEIDNSTGNGIPLTAPADMAPPDDANDTVTYNLLAAVFNASEDASLASSESILKGTGNITNPGGSSFTTIPDLFSNYLLEADALGSFRLVNYTNDRNAITPGITFSVFNNTIVSDDDS